MTAIFWIALAVVIYTYIGYPLCLSVIKRGRRHSVKKEPFEPTVSVILSVRNEEGNIVRRLENILVQDYPPEKVEIIVVSDGSKDRTLEILRGFQSKQVKTIELSGRNGKAVALNAGVAQAAGELLVFCDARQSFERDAIKQLSANFADRTVGCASGELILLRDATDGIQVEVGIYWKYEKWIRKSESATGSVMGATGAIYAMRRSLYKELPPGTLLDDVMTPMHVVMQGFRTVFDESAKAYDIASADVSQEWVRKVRTLSGNWQLLRSMPEILIPFHYCCWRFVSHKVLRLLVPVALLSVLVTGYGLKGDGFQLATRLQLLFYAMAALGGVVPATRRFRVVNICYFFVVMNAAAVVGFYLWVTGQQGTVWKPAYSQVFE